MSGIPFSSFPLANIAEIQADFQLYAESPNGEAFRVQLDEAVAAVVSAAIPPLSITLAQMISTGLVAHQIAVVGTTAVITEETLFSYTIPANFIAADGQGLEVNFFGIFAGNANTKTLRVKIGATTFVINGITAAPNGEGFLGSFNINRGSASNSLTHFGELIIAFTTQGMSGGATTLDLTIANTLTITGQNGVATVNDIRLFSVIVKVLR